MDLNGKLKQLPQRPGVYMMKNSVGNIIYVGKAKNLKNRVSQYFGNYKDREPKVKEMIRNIHTFDYLITDTELDALLDECRLIKTIKPIYNRHLKNTAKYLYIKITAEKYPQVKTVKEKKDDDAIYFGPFTSRHSVEITVQYLNEFYPIRKCTGSNLSKSTGGCLFRQLGSCMGVCTGQISQNAYRAQIEKIQRILNGNDLSIFAEIPKLMDLAIENLDFEQAAQYREYYLGLQNVIRKQRLVKSSNRKRNILAVEFTDPGRAKLFLIKGNKLLHRELIKEDILSNSQHIKQIVQEKLLKELSDMSGLTQHDIDEAQIIYSYLRKNRNRIMCFWIPSTRIKTPSLDVIIVKITNRIFSGNNLN